jgi:hypothetical protein
MPVLRQLLYQRDHASSLARYQSYQQSRLHSYQSQHQEEHLLTPFLFRLASHLRYYPIQTCICPNGCHVYLTCHFTLYSDRTKSTFIDPLFCTKKYLIHVSHSARACSVLRHGNCANAGNLELNGQFYSIGVPKRVKNCTRNRIFRTAAYSSASELERATVC